MGYKKQNKYNTTSTFIFFLNFPEDQPKFFQLFINRREYVLVFGFFVESVVEIEEMSKNVQWEWGKVWSQMWFCTCFGFSTL